MRCCFIERRDRILLEKIIGYCDRIADNLNRYQNSFDAFQSDLLFQDACCMCIVQIGELVGQLSEEIKRKTPRSRGERSRIRGTSMCMPSSIDLPSVWETLQQDIPALKASCDTILNPSTQ